MSKAQAKKMKQKQKACDEKKKKKKANDAKEPNDANDGEDFTNNLPLGVSAMIVNAVQLLLSTRYRWSLKMDIANKNRLSVRNFCQSSVKPYASCLFSVTATRVLQVNNKSTQTDISKASK